MKNLKFLATLFVFGSLLFTACDKDDDGMTDNEQELITTVQLTFIDADSASLVFNVKDLDGDGGNPPVADEIKLKANTAYTLSVKFLDESDASHTHDITEEVEEESDEHLVCFTATGAMVAPVATDTDTNGKPLGLQNSLTTGNAGSGSLTVSLKHEPDKSAAAPCSTGETDAEVTFPVVIE
jgi:hypothetical protein